jgi:hypothetical protein
MEPKSTKNNFTHPSVIIAVLVLMFVGGYFLLSKNQNPSQSEIDALKTEVKNLKNSQTQTSNVKPSSNSPASKSLTKIIQEWRKSTAYVECYWTNPNTGLAYYKQSGSGLLVMVDTVGYVSRKQVSIPNVVTNLHVINSDTYGIAQECDVGFPDNQGVFYSTATATNTSGNQTMIFNYDKEHDVAYLLALTEKGGTPPISLEGRAKTGSFACTSEPSIGDPLVILGYPSYGTGAEKYISANSNLEITATEGIISGKDDIYYTTSAKIEHGNSGGLAIDKTNDCYLGIPTAAVAGQIESLGRIFPASYIVKWLSDYAKN